mgnify:CR=1 FL=1
MIYIYIITCIIFYNYWTQKGNEIVLKDKCLKWITPPQELDTMLMKVEISYGRHGYNVFYQIQVGGGMMIHLGCFLSL